MKFKNKVMNDYMSLKALYELQLLREEMKKDNPSPEKISNLLCGDKYNGLGMF